MRHISKTVHKASELIYTLLFFGLTWLVISALMVWGKPWLYILGLPVLVVAVILLLAEIWSLTGTEEIEVNATGIIAHAHCLGWSREITVHWAHITQLELTPKWTYSSDNPAPRRIDRLSRVPFFASYGQLRFKAEGEQMHLGVCLSRARALDILRHALAQGWIAPWQLSRAADAYIHPPTIEMPPRVQPVVEVAPVHEAGASLAADTESPAEQPSANTPNVTTPESAPADNTQLPPISIS